MLKILIIPISLALSFTTSAGQKWETCVPSRCSQTVVTFDNLSECIKYQSYMGSKYKRCTPPGG